MSTSADRLTAARLLLRVEAGAYSTRLLGGAAHPGVRVRVLGVLRWQLSLDRALEGRVRRPVPDLDPEVRVTLRLELHDGAILGVPWPVAVDAAVRLVRRLGRSSASGMVNAVLRRAGPELDRLLFHGSPAERSSHPERRWKGGGASGPRASATAAFEADQRPADLWVCGAPRPPDRRTARRRTSASNPTRGAPGRARSEGPVGRLIDRVADGRAYAQDPSSQLVALVALAAAPDAATIVDLCAAPGGKAALMAARRPGARLLALDRHLGRSRLVAGLLPGGRGTADATAPPLAARSVDLVL